MPRRLLPARRFACVALPLALAAGSLPGQAARAAPGELQRGDLLRMAQAPAAQAPTAQAPTAQTPSEGEVGGFSQAQLESYANAVLKVQEIDEAWSPRIAQAPSKAEAETLTAQATDEMIGGIEAEGLSVEEYNAITQAAQRDNQLYERIMTLLAQAK